MKTTKITQVMMISFSLLMFFGCKPATKAGVRTYSNAIGSNIYNQGTGQYNQGTGQFFNVNNCMTNEKSIGSVYDSSNSTQFENQVKSFLSAVTLPSDIGTISSSATDLSTGVRFSGALKLDQNGAVVLTQSKVNMTVYDSFSAQGAKPIPVDINQASSGQFNLQTGVGYVIFTDGYGEIRFDGKIDSSWFSGTVTYKNYKTVVTNSAPASGTLGQFYISSCGFVQ